MVLVLVFLVLAVFVSWRLLKNGKRLSPLGTITMVTGAVKCGKSTLAVHLAMKSYRKSFLLWCFKKLLPKYKNLEMPHLYSNIPLKCRYVPLSYDVIMRRERIAQKSVVLIDECSLLADSQLVKNQDINEQLLLFYKLFGHMSHGGTLVLDTQSIEDNHYAVKRCVNSYLYIYRLKKLFPFFCIGKVVEQRYSADGTIVSAETGDIEDITKTVIIPKAVWKRFDTYAFSAFTDNLPCSNTDEYADTLKADKVLSLRDSFRTLRVPAQLSAEAGRIPAVPKSEPKCQNNSKEENDIMED